MKKTNKTKHLCSFRSMVDGIPKSFLHKKMWLLLLTKADFNELLMISNLIILCVYTIMEMVLLSLSLSFSITIILFRMQYELWLCLFRYISLGVWVRLGRNFLIEIRLMLLSSYGLWLSSIEWLISCNAR